MLELSKEASQPSVGKNKAAKWFDYLFNLGSKGLIVYCDKKKKIKYKYALLLVYLAKRDLIKACDFTRLFPSKGGDKNKVTSLFYSCLS